MYAELIRFHNNITVARNVDFCTHDLIHRIVNKMPGTETHHNEHIGCIEIMDNVFIGSNSVILDGVRIGPNVIVASGCVCVCAYVSAKIQRPYGYLLVQDANTFLAVALGICSFLFVKNIKLPYNRWINLFGASTFGVLLIHLSTGPMHEYRRFNTEEASEDPTLLDAYKADGIKSKLKIKKAPPEFLSSGGTFLKKEEKMLWLCHSI